jgi:hypothetical protein
LNFASVKPRRKIDRTKTVGPARRYDFQQEDIEEKKLLGSGGYVLAMLRGNLGVPQIFLSNVEIRERWIFEVLLQEVW